MAGEGRWGGLHTMRIDVCTTYVGANRPLCLVPRETHVTIRPPNPKGNNSKGSSWNKIHTQKGRSKEGLSLTEEWESLPPTGLLPRESLEPEKQGHLTGVKAGYWQNHSAGAGNEWGNTYSKLFHPGLKSAAIASQWGSLIRTRGHGWSNPSLPGNIAGGTC